MNKAQLIDALSARLGDKRAATQALDAVLTEIQHAVTKGNKVAITGFGVFEKKVRAARTARNPRTGETVKVKKTSVPAFRPGAGFRELVASGKLPKVAVAKKATVKTAPATKAAPAKTTAKAAPAKTATKAAAAKTAAKATKAAPAKKTVTKAAPAKKSVAKAAPVKKSVAKAAPAKKTVTKATPVKSAAKVATKVTRAAAKPARKPATVRATKVASAAKSAAAKKR